MAQIELRVWPPSAGSDAQTAASLHGINRWFKAAVGLDPSNRTAHHRLGLLAVEQRNFSQAVRHLSLAHAIDGDHRGVVKSLGYTYIWLGEFDRALPLLKAIPEARYEMEIYIWWWGTQGREDLAGRASQGLELLERAGAPYTSTPTEP
jgi:tetratricopeptide (TPR) repeat protein